MEGVWVRIEMRHSFQQVEGRRLDRHAMKRLDEAQVIISDPQDLQGEWTKESRALGRLDSREWVEEKMRWSHNGDSAVVGRKGPAGG